MNSFLALFVIVVVYFSKVNSEEESPTELPQCKAKALALGEDTVVVGKSIWWVGNKLVEQIVEPFDVPNCSPPVIRSVCGGMKIEINRSADASRIFTIAAWDDEYKNVACSEISYPLAEDQTLLVFTGDVLKYGTISTDNALEDLPNIPELYKPSRGKIAVIAISTNTENTEWMVMEDCEKKAIWVLYSEAVVNAKQIDNFKSDVEKAVQDAGFEVSKLTPVPTTIQSETSACIVPTKTTEKPAENPQEKSEEDSKE